MLVVDFLQTVSLNELSSRYAIGVKRRAYEQMCDGLESDFARLSAIPDQKSFAAEANQTRCAAPLFAIRARKSRSVREYFATATLPGVERALGIDLTNLIAASEDDAS